MNNDINLFQNICLIPTRNVDNRFPSLEALQAEMWIWTYFRSYYKRKYGDANTFVVTGLSYLTDDYRNSAAFKAVEEVTIDFLGAVRKYTEYYLKGIPNSKVFNIILKWLRSDFRNMYSGKKLKDLSKLSGGLRKPDILGIRFEGNSIILELLEVTTEGQASSTIVQDLESKKEILDSVVKGNIEREIATEQLATGMSIGPTNVEIVYSKWKPDGNQLVVPLLTNVGKSDALLYEWICYKPTFRYNKGQGQDGLILYEIHSVGNAAMVPSRVVSKIASEIRRMMTKSTFELTLTPFLESYWKENYKDEREIMGYIAAGCGLALVMTVAVMLWPVMVAAAEAAALFLASTATVTAAATVKITAEAIAIITSAAISFPQVVTLANRIIESVRINPALQTTP